jgi:hypothetical protein
VNWKRTPKHARARARFSAERQYTSSTGSPYRQKGDVSIAKACERLDSELRKLNATDVVLSTNVPTRLDGFPRSSAPPPDDEGVAVYFSVKKKKHVLASDKWDRVADNIVAVAKHIEALRGMERWGVGSLEQAFAGYAALPASTSHWSSVLGLSENEATVDAVQSRYRKLAHERHPDRGGSNDSMQELTQARDAAMEYLNNASA